MLACVCHRTVRADAVDELIHAQMTRNHIPAVCLAVVRDGQIAKLQAYGVANLEWNAAATTNTTFQLASATKPFTGSLLMKLVERGKLRLDDSVTRFFTNAPSTWKPITVRHLAAHTSGLSDKIPKTERGSVEKVVNAAMELPLSYEPGTKSAYGFTDYVVLSAILEKVSGKPYAALLHDLISEPLGLTGTAFNHEAERGPARISNPLPERAPIHRWSNGRQQLFDFLYEQTGYSAGGLHSSAADLARLFVALQRGELLQPASLSEMWTRPPLKNGTDGEFGLGWVVRTYRGQRIVGHSGGPALADLLYFPERKLAVAVLCNQQRMFPYLAEAVADLYLPPIAAAPAIADNQLKLTAELKNVLAAAAEGKLVEDAIAPEARKPLSRTLKEAGPMAIGIFGPVRDLQLLEERKDASKWTRKYRVRFDELARVWIFELMPDGKIVNLQPGSE